MQELKGYNITDQYGCYFVTFTIVAWVDLFTRKECKDIIIDSFRFCQEKKGLQVHAFVIMSSHIHLILSAKENSDGLSNIVRDFKSYTSKELVKWIIESNQESRKEWLKIVFAYYAKFNSNNQHYQIWQQNNQPKACLHPKFTIQKINYIHNNPVQAGIVDEAEHYRYSSVRNYLDLDKTLLNVVIINYGIQEGYIAL